MSDSDLKTCPFCAEQIQQAAVICRFCNRDLAGTVATSYSAAKYARPAAYSEQAVANDRNSNRPGRRWGWVIVIAGLSILAALNGQTLFAYVSGIVTGQVTIDTGKLTNNITKGIKDQTGVDVSVTCPTPFLGHVGDTRQCTYTSVMGPGFIDVRIQSTNADVTWQVN